MSDIRLSVKAIIVEGGQLLALKCRDAEGDWFMLPGGGQGFGETVHEALEQFAYVPLGGFAVGSKDPSVEPWCAYDVVDPRSDRASLAEQIEKGLNTSHHMRSRWHLTEMSYIVEATRHKLYEDYGYESAPEWVASFLGVGYTKACETVDIAVMLEELVHLRQAYGNGSISYDHLRALVRVATTWWYCKSLTKS